MGHIPSFSESPPPHPPPPFLEQLNSPSFYIPDLASVSQGFGTKQGRNKAIP